MLDLSFALVASKTLGLSGNKLGRQHLVTANTIGAAKMELGVNTFTGNLFLKTFPLVIEDLGGPLDLSLVFNSKKINAHPWQFAFESKLHKKTDQVIFLQEEDGAELQYKLIVGSKNTYQLSGSPRYIGSTITFTSDQFIWHNPITNTRKVYDKTGVLLSRIDQCGHHLSYHYDRKNRLQKIVSSSGNEYVFERKDLDEGREQLAISVNKKGQKREKTYS